MRNLLWMAGLTIATTSLVGITYAWLPVVVLCGAGLLSRATDDPWSLYGLLFHSRATAGQMCFAATVAACGLLGGMWDPHSRGYLRRKK